MVSSSSDSRCNWQHLVSALTRVAHACMEKGLKSFVTPDTRLQRRQHRHHHAKLPYMPSGQFERTLDKIVGRTLCITRMWVSDGMTRCSFTFALYIDMKYELASNQIACRPTMQMPFIHNVIVLEPNVDGLAAEDWLIICFVLCVSSVNDW